MCVRVYLKGFSIILVGFGGRDVCFRKTSNALEGSGQPEVLARTRTQILCVPFLLLAVRILRIF